MRIVAVKLTCAVLKKSWCYIRGVDVQKREGGHKYLHNQQCIAL